MKQAKKYIGYLVLIATLALFVYYIRNNPEVVTQLRTTSLATIIIVLFLYSLMTYFLVLISKIVIDMSGLIIDKKENALLTMYSSIVNFFGPLQSGPGFRVIYLKKKHDINIKRYLSVNIVYYFFFAVVSGLFILSGLTSILVAVLLGATFIIGQRFFISKLIIFSKFFSKISKQDIGKMVDVYSGRLLLLSIFTLAQLLVITLVYLVELRSIDSSITLGQALVYAGAANFSLFVSLTPGALGFRESFLIFSQRIHGIDTSTIVAASILDRALFIFFLCLMMLVIILVHGQSKLTLNRSES